MLNMDMVGRLKDNKLIIYGTGTATQFDPLAERLAKEFGFEISKKPEGFGPSDHSSFYAKQIPVLHYFTGTHTDYHRPSDDFDKLDIAGIRRIAQMMAATAIAIAEAPEKPQYLEAKGGQFVGGGGDRPYFGSIPDFAQDKPGYGLTGGTKGSPADKAGIQAGDIIVQLGESKIGNLSDFDSALRKFKGGDKVPVVVKRGDADVKLEVVLDPPK
jgi:membrane-associated protease RseP (regulator of RpoE activity)